MPPKFETDRLILKPRTIDNLESCIKVDYQRTGSFS